MQSKKLRNKVPILNSEYLLFSFKSVFVFCRLAELNLKLWLRKNSLESLLNLFSELPSLGLYVLASYEQGPSLRISGGHQNQTQDICSIKAN